LKANQKNPSKKLQKEHKHRSISFKGLVKTVFCVIVLVLIILAVGAALFLREQQKIIKELETSIENLKLTTVPLRFMVLSRSDKELSARFRFYDGDGKEIASFERSWNGSDLYIDSLVVPLKTGAMAFPVRVFTDAVAPRGGTNLMYYYDFNGIPGIYDSSRLNDQQRQILKELFTKLKTAEGLYGSNAAANPGERLLTYFGNAVHDIKQLRQFEVGTIYSLVIHTDGGIEILSE